MTLRNFLETMDENDTVDLMIGTETDLDCIEARKLLKYLNPELLDMKVDRHGGGHSSDVFVEIGELKESKTKTSKEKEKK